MTQLFLLSEPTSAERQFYLHLVDATDGITPETGEAAGQPQISKNGGAFANTSATLSAVGNGLYYVVLTTTELNTLGYIVVRYKSANTCEFQGLGQVVAFDMNDAAGLGLTNVNATISSRASQTSLDTVDDFLDTEIAALTTNLATANTNITTIDDILDTEFPALVTAVGVIDDFLDTEVAAILAAVDTEIGTLQTSVNTIDDFLDTEIAAIKAKTDNLPAAPAATGDIPTAAVVAAAVWDEALSGHTTAGTAGKALSDSGSTSAATIADAVWDELLTDHVTASTTGKKLGDLTNGTGALTHTHTVTDGSNPLDGVFCWVTASNDMAATVVASGYTNALGVVNLALDAGTYYLWQQHSGYTFTNPVTITVS